MQNKSSTPIRRVFGLVALTAIVAGLSGCATAPPLAAYQQYHPAPYPHYPTPLHAQGRARELSDGQVVGILAAANIAEIREAQLALRISRNPHVRGFARQMVIDHSWLNSRMLALASRLGIAPEQSAASQHLMRTAQQADVTLVALNGRRFDSLYTKHQVDTHRTVLNGINRILLPNIGHPRLRIAVRQIKAVIAGHLRHARYLQAHL